MKKLYPGIKINKWTLLSQKQIINISGKKTLKWECKCSCGTISKVTREDLLKGKSKGCRKCAGTMPDDISGKIYGQWTVLSCDIKKLNRRYCNCRCSCGSEYVVAAQTLKNGSSTKCIECYNVKRDGTSYTGHVLYQTWKTMHNRCELKSNHSYKNYGARGITVCKRWDVFNNFISDMGDRPSRNHSIDRIDNNKGYSFDNCRWATREQQTNNTRRNRTECYNGECLNLSQWARNLNVNVDTLWKYLERNSFDVAYKHFK